MPIEFSCEHCGRRLRVAARKIGATVTCPKCHQATTVAGEPETPDLPEPQFTAPLLAAEPLAPPAPDAALHAPSYSPLEPPLPAGASPLPTESDRGLSGASKGAVDFRKVSVSRLAVYAQGLLLIVLAATAFGLGVFVGRKSQVSQDAALLAGPFEIAGQVLYDPGTHQATPDAGSVVILLPQETRPAEKLEHLGLRPEEPPPDEAHPALAAIREWGGDYARANARGEYRLEAPQGGSYFLLWLSHNSSRTSSEPLDRKDLAQIGRYFLAADELISPTQHRWSEITVRQDRRIRQVFR